MSTKFSTPILGAVLPCFLAACAASPSANSEQATFAALVKIGKSDPSPDCTELGVVKGEDPYRGPEGAYRALRLDAAKKRADYVRLDYATPYGRLVGTAFRCGRPSVAANRSE